MKKNLATIERVALHRSLMGMNASSFCQLFCDGIYVLPPLPYDAAALEPLIDAQTLSIHHDRHHAAYVAGANRAVESLRAVAQGRVDAAAASADTQNLAFHLGGHLLHSLYWHSMTPNPQPTPEGVLADAINRDFSDFEGFLRVFRNLATSVQGSGWAVLGIDPVSRRLLVYAITRHQDSLSPAFIPLLACDVWEHAYYLRYHNNRAGYVDAFIQLIDWKGTEERYNHHLAAL